MANISFGTNINETAQESGYDQYSFGLRKTLGAVAGETWDFNPLMSLVRLTELTEAKIDDSETEPLVSKDILNEKYNPIGLEFEDDEKQSVVDILVERKKNERRRQDIIQRGPQGILPGTAKLLTGIGVSVLDPINIASAFVPVLGQARFASLAGRFGLNAARTTRGVVEGAVGATLVEPIVYAAATSEQADYGLRDSFLNVTFGSIIGGGLHVGSGKLKDIRSQVKFRKAVREAKQKFKGEELEAVTDALYKKYYPENTKLFKHLDESSPEFRETMLKKALGDLFEERPVDVTQVKDLDPNFRTAEEFKVESIKPKSDVKNQTEIADQKFENILPEKDLENRNIDQENLELNGQLEELKLNQQQKGIDLEANENINKTKKLVEETKTNQEGLKNALREGLFCINGK
ncbi:hypothetical protein KY321_02245 [Candidatus Woesearchaeota archaeon]|nr:hypothetical protein [Candidatus Woesearchaeota archaeon]